MDPISAPTGERTQLTESILDLYSAFCAALLIGQQDSWLSVDLTMPQIKVLLLIVTWGQATTSRIAKRLGVALPSATRFVDRLAEHGLVAREEDPRDRRFTNIVPTPAARQLVECLNNYRREYVGAALAGLDLDQLREVRQGFRHLVAACPSGDPEPAEAATASAHG